MQHTEYCCMTHIVVCIVIYHVVYIFCIFLFLCVLAPRKNISTDLFLKTQSIVPIHVRMRAADQSIVFYNLEGRPPPISPHTLLPITSQEYDCGTLSIFRSGKLEAFSVQDKILVTAPLRNGRYGLFFVGCMPTATSSHSDSVHGCSITGEIFYVALVAKKTFIIEPCDTTRMKNFVCWMDGDDLRIECPSECTEFWCKIPAELILEIVPV